MKNKINIKFNLNNLIHKIYLKIHKEIISIKIINNTRIQILSNKIIIIHQNIRIHLIINKMMILSKDKIFQVVAALNHNNLTMIHFNIKINIKLINYNR
jgi:hypothetical protein